MATKLNDSKKSCSLHTDEPYKFYCATCKIILCPICAVKSHKQCDDVLTFSEAIEHLKLENGQLLKATEDQSNVIASYIKDKEAELQRADKAVAEAKTEIQSIFDKLYTALDDKKQDLMRKIDELSNEERGKATEELSALYKLLKSSEKIRNCVEDNSHKKSDYRKVKTIVSVKSIFHEINRSLKNLKDRQMKLVAFQESENAQEIMLKFKDIGRVIVMDQKDIYVTLNGGHKEAIEVPENKKSVSFAEIKKSVRFAEPIPEDIVANENDISMDINGEILQHNSSPDGELYIKDLEFKTLFDETETSTEDEFDDSDEHLTPGDDNDDTKRNTSDDMHPENLKLPNGEQDGEESMQTSIKTDVRITTFSTVNHTKPSWIYGSAFISNDKLALTDVAHDSVQIYGINGGLILEKIVSFTPWDVTRVTDDSFAVSAGGRGTVHVFKYKDGDIAEDKVLNVGSDAISLTYANDRFFIGTRNGVVILSEQVEETVKIDKYNGSTETLRRTDFISVDASGDRMFLVNSWRNKIIAMTTQGDMLWEFEGQGHNSRGITWCDGTLCVCSRNQGKVIRISIDGRIEKDMVAIDVDYPYAVAHHPSDNMVAVTQWDERIDADRSRTVKIIKYI